MKVEVTSLGQRRFGSVPSFYHSAQWLSALENSYKNKLLLVAVNENGKLLNTMPVFLIKSKLFGNKIVSLPYCEYGGPTIADRKSFDRMLKEVEQLGEKHNVDYVEIRSPNEKLESTIKANGFVRKFNYCTFVLDLKKPLDKMWRSFDKKVRNSVRKAEKNNVKVVDELDVDTFYKLHSKTMKKLGSPQHPKKLFKNLVRFCKPNVKIVFAKYNNKKIAASFFFLYNKKIYYWKNASDEKFLHLRPNDLILYKTIEWGQKNGYKFLDMGRTTEGTGTYLFKRRWGGKKVELKDFYKLRKKIELADVHSKKYELFISLWKKIPSFVTNIAGPHVRRNFP